MSGPDRNVPWNGRHVGHSATGGKAVCSDRVGVGTNTPLRPPPPPDGQLDLAAIRTIRRRKDTAALLGLLSRDDAQASAKLRRSIVMGLTLSRDPESAQTIMGLAEHDPDHKVRLRAMAGLRALGNRSTVPFLAHTLEHTSNVAIKLHAIGALANTFANDAVRPLIKALEDSSAMVRTAAADALAQIGDPAAVSAIEAARRRAWNPYVRVSLSHALRRLRQTRELQSMTHGPHAHIAETRGYLRATLHLLPTERGGRKTPIAGVQYRPNWSIGPEPDATRMSGAPLFTDNGENVAPGESAEVRLFPMYPEFWAGVTPGTQLFAFEGLRLVGRAVVTSVVPPLARPDPTG